MSEMTMGQRIADGRKKLGLSQEALGERMGVSRQAISKWEADGAVPEIDKLIALSKLFGVTVGWLLGVEDAQEQQSADPFTDEQLKLLEQIVRSYQPPQAPATPEETPRPRRWPRIAAAVIAVTILFSVWSELNQQINNASHQISGLHSGYSSILSQLGLLAERLDAIAEGEKLVSEVTFDAVAWEDRSGADIFFQATPRSWKVSTPSFIYNTHGDIAYISVRVAGEEVQQFPCQWNGAACQAQMSLAAENGYSFYYVVYHEGGTQEQQLLKNTGLENLADALELRCKISVDPSIENNTLVFHNYHMAVDAPKIRHENEELYFTSLAWVLTVNEVEQYREAISEHLLDDQVNNAQIGSTGRHVIPLPSASVGDTIALYVEVVLSDGTHLAEPAATFRLTDSGWVEIAE